MANSAAVDAYPAGKITIQGPARLDRANSTPIPIAILHHPALSAGAKLVYSKFLNYAWASATASNKRLAADLGMSTRGIRNYVAELKAAQLVRVQTQPGKPNSYTVSTDI